MYKSGLEIDQYTPLRCENITNYGAINNHCDSFDLAWTNVRIHGLCGGKYTGEGLLTGGAGLRNSASWCSEIARIYVAPP